MRLAHDGHSCACRRRRLSRSRYLRRALACERTGDSGQVSVPDLPIAATAELAQLTVLHIDADYEVIADLTGQPVERLRIA